MVKMKHTDGTKCSRPSVSGSASMGTANQRSEIPHDLQLIEIWPLGDFGICRDSWVKGLLGYWILRHDCTLRLWSFIQLERRILCWWVCKLAHPF